MPKFSFCLIAKDETKVLPRLMESLKEFQSQGGEVVCLDTGSKDATAELARSYGWKVEEVGEKYLHLLTVEEIFRTNQKFVIEDEPAVVKNEDKYFDFASARNHAASLATNDMVSFIDADEVMTKLDVAAIDALIDAGNEQFEYNFVFAHDQFGKPAIEFVQSKFYDRRKVQWVGLVHEVLSGSAKMAFLSNDIFRLEHFQEAHDRHSYLIGLAVDCFMHPEKDRNSHYFARELFWTGRLKSALKEFERHVTMGGWHSERSESYLFMGDIYGRLNQPQKQVEAYSTSFYIDSARREPLMKLAEFYLSNKNYQAAVTYAKGALEIPWSGFYASNKAYYEQTPHEVLYKAYGWLGRIPEAQEHILKALKFQPNNADYLRDTKYYFGEGERYQDKGIEGWMLMEELQYLYELGKKYETIVECGSWAGRSTDAFLSGNKGTVTAIDSWLGSSEVKDSTNWMAKERDMFEVFKKNVGSYPNLKIIKKLGLEAANDFEDESVDVVFIDMGHTYSEVKADILAWKSKVKKGGILCGHDYMPNTWQEVIEAVDETLGKPDELHGTIWTHFIK